ncbi:hypothetical protein [Streptomyces sp. NPDC047009]|uniref:hypothetical protein n=1 Tax=unclassified Streptomyces TaxID=2593676 RepID=UPI0033C5F0A2
MTSGERQRGRDGSPKRAQLTSGDHSGPKDKRGKAPRVVQPDRQQKKAAAKREWRSLFMRLEEVKRREQERQKRSSS